MEIIENEILKKIREQMLDNIENYNNAVRDNDLAKANNLDNELKQLESDYMLSASKLVYDMCLAKESPLEALKMAIITHSFNVLTHKDNKEDGTRELNENKLRQIDLLKLCKYSQEIKHPNKIDSAWQYDVEAFNQLFTMHIAQELNFSKADIKEIAKTYFMQELARKIDLGETPDSTTQLCKTLQKIIDKIIFVDDGKGKNTYKCNNYDVKYINVLFGKKGKSALSVVCAKHDYMRRLVYDVLYRILTNSKYSVDYKKIKEK